ncbi:hypothetical protein DFH28DRAFT_1227700 [Melampsora americana]|nr:hypothetical protein DFH28DRAFT_1227700 [Melampsora americana]
MPPLTRSKSTGTLMVSEGSQYELATLVKKGPQYQCAIAKGNTSIRKSIIEDAFRKRYKMEPRPLQVECVLLLIGLWNTFLLASTGFGKSKVPEMYLETLSKVDKPIVMVMNPLDALGDNQVLEKTKDGFTAVSLTQKTFNDATCKDILESKYQFIYLSPEIFLNSALFTMLYFHPTFQKRLALKVIDEAHLIYCWGLVASGSAKNLSCFKSLQDRGVFRPSYGNLCGRFLATDHAPILLMSATCRPKAMDAIKKNLRLTNYNLAVRMAELVRPEIRLIRMSMKFPLKYAKDLHSFFGLAKMVPNAEVPPTLIYSGTQNGTWETLSAINEARGHPELSLDGQSPFARRYHAATGTDDKIDRADNFVDLLYSVICCTMALGLGQNWKIVRRVIVMGRTEPSAVAQMIGRCGRDGRPGVGVLLVEEKRGGAGAKNHIKDFLSVSTNHMSDDERMDALAITPVCLRVAMAVDNYVGHIPISFHDKHYLEEEARQKHLNFPKCLCSNCEPQKSLEFLDRQHQATNSNFSQIVLGQMTGPIIHDSCCPPSYSNEAPDLKAILPCPDTDQIRKMPVFQALVDNLMANVDLLYDRANPDKDFPIRRRVVFNQLDHAWPIAKNADAITQGASLRAILGSEAIDGIFDCILNCISDWQQSYLYQMNMKDIDTMRLERMTKAKKKADQAAKRAKSHPKRKITETAKIEPDQPFKRSRPHSSAVATLTPANMDSNYTQSSSFNSNQHVDSHNRLNDQYENQPSLPHVPFTPQLDTPVILSPALPMNSQRLPPSKSRIITPTSTTGPSTAMFPARYLPQHSAISPLANISTRVNQPDLSVPTSPLLHQRFTNNVTNMEQQRFHEYGSYNMLCRNQPKITTPRLSNSTQTTSFLHHDINTSRYRVSQPRPSMPQTPGPNIHTPSPTMRTPLYNSLDNSQKHMNEVMNEVNLTQSAPLMTPNSHYPDRRTSGPSITTPSYDSNPNSLSYNPNHNSLKMRDMKIITQSAPPVAARRSHHMTPLTAFQPNQSNINTNVPSNQNFSNRSVSDVVGQSTTSTTLPELSTQRSFEHLAFRTPDPFADGS